MEYNLFVAYALITRVAAILLLIIFVLPVQWTELNRQLTNKRTFNSDYWKLALTLILVVMSTVAFSIIPITYQLSRLDSPGIVSLQNWSSFLTNTVILMQSIGWVLIYRRK